MEQRLVDVVMGRADLYATCKNIADHVKILQIMKHASFSVSQPSRTHAGEKSFP